MRIRKPKPFKPTSPMMRLEAAEAKRAFNSPQDIDGLHDPHWVKTWDEISSTYRKIVRDTGNAANRRQRSLILYAASLGQKHGRLPADLSVWQAEIVTFDFLTGLSEVVFTSDVLKVSISLRYLDWVPDEPVDLTDYAQAA